MVEDGPDGKIWIEMVKDRTGGRLRKIITEHTATGTVVFTDSWKAYDRLSSSGREHDKVNHKENFVSHQQRRREARDEEESVSDAAEDWEEVSLFDDSVVVHTNKIERAWREIKRGLVNHPIRLLSRNIGVEMFRYNHFNVKPYSRREGTSSSKLLPNIRQRSKSCSASRSQCILKNKTAMFRFLFKTIENVLNNNINHSQIGQ